MGAATCHIVAFRGLAFRLISRAGCSVHELLASPHQRLPFRMFRLLNEPDLAEELCQLPSCLWDEWSADMKAAHPTLSGADFHKKLELAALLGR